MRQDKRYAYCTFLIGSDRYLPGILTFAYTLRKQNIDADLICTVADDIPAECIRAIQSQYDCVFRVRQTRVENQNKKKRGDREKLFTRYAVLDALQREKLKYDKIIICDSDLLPLRNFAELCRYPAPSGILNERKEHAVGRNAQGEWIWYDVYRHIPPKAGIPKEITDRVKTDPRNLGVNSAIYIFDSDTIPYDEIEADICKEETRALISTFPWPDMQYMTYKLSGRWHNLDIRFASFNSFPSLHSVYGTHYAGMKPWDIHNRSYLHYCGHDDYKLWICVFLNMMREHPGLGRNTRLRKLRNFLLELVKSDEQYVLSVRNYPELRHILRC